MGEISKEADGDVIWNGIHLETADGDLQRPCLADDASIKEQRALRRVQAGATLTR